MICEADFKECPNEATWELIAFGCNAKLKVCNEHKEKYCFKGNPLMQTAHKIGQN